MITTSVGLGLIYSMLTGKGTFSLLDERGVGRSFLVGDELRVFDFVKKYHMKYGAFPNIRTVTAETKVSFPSFPDEPIDYWIQRVEDRKHSAVALATAQEMKDAVSSGDVDKIRRLAGKLYVDVCSFVSGGRTYQFPVVARDVLDLHDRVQISSGLSGIPFGIPYIDAISGGAQPADAIVLAGSPSIGKCIPENRQVQTSSGEFVSIGSLRCEKIHSWKETNISWEHPQKILSSGKRQCLRFILSDGNEVEVGKDHRLFVGEYCGECEAKKIKVGDHLAVPLNLPEIEEPVPMPYGRVIINAMLLAEGGVTTNHTTWSNTDPQLISLMREVLLKERLFLVKRKNSKPAEFFITNRNGVSGFGVRLVLEKMEVVYGVKSKNKIISDCIFRLPNDLLAVWIGAFYSCDGSKGVNIDLTLGSKDLIYQIKNLLLRLGIFSSVKFRSVSCNGKKFPAWRLTVSGRYRKIFIEKIPLFSSKRMTFRYQKDLVLIPEFQWLSYLIKSKWEQGWHYVGKREDKYDRTKVFCRGRKNGIVRAQLNLMAVKYGFKKEIDWLSDLEWVKVIKIESLGKRRCVDIQMPDTPWFVCDSVLTHNSYLMFQLCLNCFASGGVPFLGTFEMSAIQVVRRMMALRNHVTAMMIRLGKLSHWAREILENDTIWLEQKKLPFHIFEGGLKTTIDDVIIRVQEVRPSALYIDGAYLLKVPGRALPIVDRIREVAETLKTVAKEFKIPVFSSYQFNKKGESLRNIYAGDVVAQLGSIVIGIRDEEDDEVSSRPDQHRFDSNQEFKILDLLKGREGERGKIRIVFDMQTMTIEEDAVLQGFLLKEDTSDRID